MSPTYPGEPLSDGVILLRPWTTDDLACVEAASRDPRIPEMTTVPGEYGEAEGRAWIERQHGRLALGEGLSLAIADVADGVARGYVGLLLREAAHGTAGIGYWLVPDALGGGRATRAVALLARWALAEAGVARVEAHVEAGNEASQRVLERAGFRREALLRSYLSFPTRRADALVYAFLPD
ncbi:MAG TPA: GNAT family N-acetyltransferase [Gaiellaceae bacterium]|nr:GNAT family N-acetyltransferase [Gaiellaceae bacterium]